MYINDYMLHIKTHQHHYPSPMTHLEYSWFAPFPYKACCGPDYVDIVYRNKIVIALDGFSDKFYISEHIHGVGKWTMDIGKIPIDPDFDMRYLILEAFQALVKQTPTIKMHALEKRMAECL